MACKSREEKIWDFTGYAYKKFEDPEFFDDYYSYSLSSLAHIMHVMGANFPSGLISETALDLLLSGKIKRKGLTHEHYNGRTRTIHLMFDEYQANKNKPKDEVRKILYKKACWGLQTHFVTKKENEKLSPIQNKNPEAGWKNHYDELDIRMVLDPGPKMQVYFHNDIVFVNQEQLAEYFDISKYQAAKLVKAGKIEKSECYQNELLRDSSLTVYGSTPQTTFQSTLQTKNAINLLTNSPTSLEPFFVR